MMFAVTIAAACGTEVSSWPAEPFTKASWAASGEYERFRYYRSLDETQVLVGLSKVEVLELLGRPNSTAPDGCFVIYTLCLAGENDPNFIHGLQIEFNESDVVIKYSAVSD